MTHGIDGGVPTTVPGARLTEEDFARVTVDDWTEIGRLSRAYCRKVDSTRSRKRMDGSATVVHGGGAPYGTDDVSDDVTQDATLMFAQRLAHIIATCERAEPGDDVPSDTEAWTYVRRNGTSMPVTRQTLRFWAVRDAAARNGYRVDVPPDDVDATPGEQTVRPIVRVQRLAEAFIASRVAQHNETVFRMAWGDGSEYPTLRKIRDLAADADHLKHAGIFSHVAQDQYGGTYGSSRPIRRVKAAARDEWHELSERLDDARDQLVYRSAGASETD